MDFAICKGQSFVMFDCDGSAAQHDHGQRHYGPSREVRAAVAKARAICARCPVIEPCLETAMKNNEKFGVWGGLAWYERKKLRQERLEREREAG